MRFAEVFLRLGAALVAWMVLYAQFLWLAVLFRLGCGPDGAEMHRVLLGLAPLAIGMSFVLRATRPLPEIHSMLRWLGLPLLLLTPFALRSIWQVFAAVSIDARAICAETSPVTWQLAWAPAQIVTVGVILYMVYRVWQSVRLDALKAKNP